VTIKVRTFIFLSLACSLTSLTILQGTWAKLSEVAVKGAQYNSRERQPHPKCLQGTRVDILKYIHEFLDDTEKNQLVWLHGTAGVGKSAVAFTVAEKMRGLKVTEETKVEKRLGGTFFFSRKHTKRCTAGYLFATLVYQLGTNFPSIQKDVSRIIRDNPALLDPDTPLCDQMEALFLRPLRKLQPRLRGCPPLSFVIDALDECTSEPEVKDLILSLAQALCEPDLPVTHILLTSRSESYICKAFQNEEVRPLVREIPVRTSGKGGVISLDGADVDNDICTFLRYSFEELESRHPNFPQPSEVDLWKLASRAGRRFIVASTMMKFIIDDEDSDPHDRLQLMLDFTSELLPGTEVYKLYDCILSTCADPKRAFLHLSIVAALTDPLPISQISILLGPGLGRDVQTTLIQLRSVMDIPADSTLPVNIYHSSIRDYVSDPSNCGLPQVHDLASPHSLLARSSFHLMKTIPAHTAILDALSELKKQSKAMQAEDPQRLKDSLAFLVRPPEPLSTIICMLWLRGHCSSDLQSWLGTVNGHAWLHTQAGRNWLQTQAGRNWMQNQAGREWLQTRGGREWLQTQAGRFWLQTRGGRIWLQAHTGRDWLQTRAGRDWLQTWAGRDWLQTRAGRDWLQTWAGRDWLQTQAGREWLPQIDEKRNRLRIRGEQEWLRQIKEERKWLLRSQEEQEQLLQIQDKRGWLQTEEGRDWLQTEEGRNWLERIEWLETHGGREWLQTERGQEWLRPRGGQRRVWAKRGQEWLLTEGGQEWLQMEGGREWLQTEGGREWLQTKGGRYWLQTEGGRDWLQIEAGRDWLQREWLQTRTGRDWLRTQAGRDWLQAQAGRDWLQTQAG